MSKFKVGDMVRTSIKLAEKHGTVYGIGAGFWEDSKTRKVLAVYDDDPAQTDYRLSGTCFFWPEYALVSAEPREFIVIRRDGQRTIAELRHGREVVKSAEARCAPTDTFDFFNEGAPRAFDRLMGREEPLYNCIGSATVKPQPAPRFKVGDRVITSIGAGTVVEVDPDIKEGKPYRIRYDDGCAFWKNSGEAKPAPEPKYYSGKVIMYDYENCPLCKERFYGKLFVFVNGRCDDEVFRGHPLFKSFDDFKDAMHNKSWIEVEK